MNRKVILISDNGGTAFSQKEISTFADKLTQLDNIDLMVVGNGEQNLTMNEILQALETVLPEQDLTIIIQSHGCMENGFEFLLGDDFSLSSKQLFQIIKNKLGDKPVDIFTQACYGGGMLIDKEELSEGSTLVSLTSLEEPNVGIDYKNMIEHFEYFTGELTAYNLLEFYLTNFLKNRFKPFIAVSGQSIYDLNNFLSNGEIKNINFDSEHFSKLGKPQKYLEVFQKIQNLKSEYDIYAVEYGLAMAICLNELKNRGLLNNQIIESRNL